MTDVVSCKLSVDGLFDVLVFLWMFFFPAIRAPHHERNFQLVFDQIVGNPIFTENLSSVEIAVVIDFFAMIREINQNAVRMAYHLDDLMDYFIIIAGGIGIFCNTLTTLCIQIGSRVFDVLG